MTNITVNISGPQLSSLLYDQLNREGDQEGFLIGEVQSHVRDTISDSHINTEKEETSISIYSAVPCDEVFSFYNSCGTVCSGKLKDILGTKQKRVVGWYRFRRETNLNILLREKAIHKSLVDLLSPSQEGVILFAAFTSSSSNSAATFNFDHTFYHLENRCFVTVPLNVVNLGDTAHSDYKIQRQLVNPYSGMYKEIMTNVRMESDIDTSTKLVTDIQESIYSSLKVICQQLAESEIKVAELERENVYLLSALVQTEEEPESEIGKPGAIVDPKCEPVKSQCQKNVLVEEVVHKEVGDHSTPSKLNIKPKSEKVSKRTTENDSGNHGGSPTF